MTRYIPALRFHALTRWYDRVLGIALDEDRFKQLLVAQAGIKPGFRVLDLGCGTGTLTLMLKRACPGARIIGLDADGAALATARRKIEAAGLHIPLIRALAFDLPFPPGSFGRVLSSLVFHHLATDAKRRTLEAVRTLLEPGGELHVADWGRAQDPLMRLAFLGVQVLDGFANTTDNVRGRLVPLMREAGFAQVAEPYRGRTLFGTLSLYCAVAP